MPLDSALNAVTARKTSSQAASSDSDDLIAQLLLGVAAVLVRLGLDSPGAESLLRRAFVTAALQKMRVAERHPTQSKLASLTGLSRLEVRTILRDRNARKSNKWNRIDQIVNAWKSDPLFLDSRGRPGPLESRGTERSFEHLAKKYGRDVTARTLRDELVRRRIVAPKNKKLVLLPQSGCISDELLAAQSDLKFLVSQLAGIDFRTGRRAYLTRQSTLLAEDRKGVEMVKRIAVKRLETVLSSLAEMSVDVRTIERRGSRRARRLLITAIVATEAEDKNQ